MVYFNLKLSNIYSPDSTSKKLLTTKDIRLQSGDDILRYWIKPGSEQIYKIRFHKYF